MTQAYLYMRYRGATGKLAVFKEVNRQLVQIGDEFGSTLQGDGAGTSSTAYISQNRAIHWEDDIYAVSYSGIWKYDVSTSGPWVLEHTFDSPQTNILRWEAQMGLIPASIDGEPVLVTAYIHSASSNDSIRVVKITSSGIFEGPTRTDAGANMDVSARIFANAISHRNSIYWMQSPGDLYRYNLKTDEFNVLQSVVGNVSVGSLCVFRDRVWSWCGSTAGVPDQTRLFRIDEFTPVLIESVPVDDSVYDGGNAPNTHLDGMPTFIIPFEDSLITLRSMNTSASADQIYNVDRWTFAPGEIDNPTRENITSGVLPVDFYDGSRPLELAPRWTVRQDPITDGPANPRYTVCFHDADINEGDPDVSVELYDWPSPTGMMTVVDAGLNNYSFSRIHNPGSTGGPYIWPGSGTLNISPPELVVNGDDIDATFTLYGPSTNNVAIALLFDKEHEYIESSGTLLSASDGFVAGAAEPWLEDVAVTGINMSGGMQITVKWSAAADGIERQDNPSVCGRIFVYEG